LRNVFSSRSLIVTRRAGRSTRLHARTCRFVVGVAILLGAAFLPAAVAAQSVPTIGSVAQVADFNSDGRPDIAVATRAADVDGSTYRIDFSLSNGLRQSVSFVSALRFLTVRAFDVDNDHDLDLVVTPILSHEVVAVWLNDGAGHFKPGVASGVPPDNVALSTAGIYRTVPQFALATPTTRRTSDTLPLSARAPGHMDAAGVHHIASAPVPQHLFTAGLSARAPPARV